MTYSEDLKKVIGQNCSNNHSYTLRAKLIRVNKKTATFEVVPNTDYPHLNEPRDKSHARFLKKIKREMGDTFKLPLYIAWNCFFF